MVTREIALKMARSFVEECTQSGLSFRKVVLFGSAAKDETHEWSDIDLLMVSDQFGSNIFENLKLYSKINIRYPVIETHPYPTHYYEKGDDFIKKIIEEGIEIPF